MPAWFCMRKMEPIPEFSQAEPAPPQSIVHPRPLLARQFSTPLPSPRSLFSPRPPAAAPSPIQNAADNTQIQEGRGVSDGGLADISSMGDSSPPQVPFQHSASFSVKRAALARIRVIGSVRGSSLKHNSDPVAGSDSNADQASGGMSQHPDESTANLNADELKVVMDRAIRYFNLNPKAGMKFLKDKKVTYSKKDSAETNARRAALFLKNTRGLNKAKIGQFLGNESLILKEYTATFDFSSHPASLRGIEAAFREYLSCFKPPGEFQQIDRVLDAFAARFVCHCDARFSRDMIHQVAFVIILANVTLHNPNIPGKTAMTREEFIAAYTKEEKLRPCGTDEEFGDLYDSIQRNELKHEEDREDLAGNLFTDPDMSGWLEIRMFDSNKLFPRLRSRWSSRWVILSQNSLYYFKKSTDVEFEGFIPLENLRLLTEHGTPSPGLQRHSLSQPPSITRTPQPEQPADQPSVLGSSSGLDGSSLLSSPRTQDNMCSPQHRNTASAPARVPQDQVDASEDEDDENGPRLKKYESLPRLVRLVSCPSSFKTSHSSLNTATASSFSQPSSFNRSGMSLLPSLFSQSEFSTFILAPIYPHSFVKVGRLEKRRLRSRSSTKQKKKLGQRRATAGEVVLQQNVYVGFRTKSRDEYQSWVKILKQVGLRRTRGGFTLPKSAVPAVGWGGGRTGFRLFSPTYALPATFSADEDDPEPSANAQRPTDPITAVSIGGAAPPSISEAIVMA